MLVLVVTSAPACQSTIAEADSLDEIEVLMLVATGFGGNYFDINETFVEWGAQVDTVAYSLDYEVDSCARVSRSITADYLVSEMTEVILSNYDCIIVPAGGHWNVLFDASPVQNLISSAYEMGLIVGSICIGNAIVADANEIVNGSKVVYYSAAWQYMTGAGAIHANARVVSHNNIVTGGTGGGFPAGYDEAPTYEVCSEIARLILRRSRVAGLILQPATGSPSTNISISVSVTDPYEDLDGVNSTEITKVEICVYHYDNDSLASAIELAPPGGDYPSYRGNISGLAVGEYYFDIEITDSEYRLEIWDTFDSFTIESDSTTPTSTPNLPPPIDSGPPMLLAGAVILLVPIAVVVVILKRGIRK
ncbi:MAG: DJ-1/PfpI family protein [Candidatus Thorarchaeota archaeon]